MRNEMGWIVAVVLMVAVPAEAGWSFRQVVRNTGTDDAAGGDVESLVALEGGDARVEFPSGISSSLFGAGSYLLLRGSAPSGLFLVDGARKTYARFDVEGLAQMGAPAGADGPEGEMQMKVSDAKVEKLLEEPGGELQGQPTTHFRFRKSYAVSMEMAPMKMVTTHEILEDSWVTTAIDLGAGGAGKLMRQASGSGTVAELEKISALEGNEPAGFTLKRVTVDHSKPKGKGMMARMMGRKEETFTSTTEVLDLESVAIPAATFAIPADYVERQLMQPGAQAPNLQGRR